MRRASRSLGASFTRSRRILCSALSRPACPFLLVASMSAASSADDWSRLTASPTHPPTDFSPSAKTPPLYDASSGQWGNPWPGWHQTTVGEGISMTLRSLRSNPLDGLDLDTQLPVLKPQWASDDSGVSYTWLGHASALLQLHGVNVLIDPIFSERCAPVQFAGPKRYRPAPCQVKDLPPIDFVLISHNHYDHLDHNTCKQLAERAERQRREGGRTMKWYVGKGIEQWLVSNLGVRQEDAVGMVWWSSATHPLPSTQSQPSNPSITALSSSSVGASTSASFLSSSSSALDSSAPLVTCVPAQHFSVRNPLTDVRRTLWCGFTVTHRSFTFYYSGDTAYCEAFKQIGQHSPHIDFAMLPIGAYEPEWFMKHIHVNPKEAVDMLLDVKADKAAAVHWGTFILTTEPAMLPRTELEAELKKRGIDNDKFVTLKHGETIRLK